MPRKRRREASHLAALVERGEMTATEAVKEWQRRVGAEASRYTMKEAFEPIWQARWNRMWAEIGMPRK